MSKFRRSGSFNISPKKVLATPGINTPIGRRQSFTTPSNSLVLLDGSGNNDEAEKRERQLNRLQQLQLKSIHSPTSVSTDKRKSLSTFAGLTNQQITEHYAKCIQLSAENKINVKNAFNLQLIDYMTELLKRKDSDMNNFQVASCTLDASTKIYGYRVDCVHTDTLKMAGGLGRTKEQADDLGENREEDADPKGKKKNKAKKCVTIETNLKNINVPHFDLEFDVDPLFKKTASQFDEGRVGGGQFMNTLQILDDTCQLLLDSETVLECGNDVAEEDGDAKNIVTLPTITDSVKLISPTFATFEFTSWKLGDENNTFTSLLNDKQTEHTFDMNAIPDPLEEPEVDNYDEDGYDDVGCEEETGLSNKTVITVGGGACRREAVPPPQLEIVHLKEHLANTPLEYSYFDTRVMSAWAGPGHWKFKPLVKDINKLQSARERQKKEFALSYGDISDVENHFSVGKSTKLSQATVKKWNIHNTTLPVDLHYNPSKLNKLYMREDIAIRRHTNDAVEDGSLNEKKFETDADNELDAETTSNYGDNTAPGYDDTDIFSQTVAPTQFSQGDLEDKTKDFLGDNLVEAPNKVSLFNIGYARTAKKIDMKKLKLSIWSLLSDSDENKENERNHEPQRIEKCNNKEFSSLYNDLGPRLPPKMTENLSVPLAFIALLHLANEYSLKLTSTQDLGDFIITQG